MIAAPPIVAIASAVAGTQVQVFCRPTRLMVDGSQGYVWFHNAIPDHTIYLDAGVCRRLSHPLNGIDAIDMLALEHEAMHIKLATSDECVVERAALANLWQTVRRFHLPAWLSRWELANAPIADASRLPAAYHEGC